MDLILTDLFLKAFTENQHKCTYNIIFKSSALTERGRITQSFAEVSSPGKAHDSPFTARGDTPFLTPQLGTEHNALNWPFVCCLPLKQGTYPVLFVAGIIIIANA